MAPKQTATALLPSTNIGLTVAANPTLFFHLPQTTAKSAEFVLQDKDGKEVYTTMLNLPGTPGVVSISLAKEKAASAQLEVGKNYKWHFGIICDHDDQAKNIYLDGSIQRVEPSPDLTNKLHKAAPKDRPSVYAEAGVWYDTVASLAELRQANPNDPKLAEDWTTLLQSVGLDTTIAQASLVGSITTIKN
jgi:hypothetical protein